MLCLIPEKCQIHHVVFVLKSYPLSKMFLDLKNTKYCFISLSAKKIHMGRFSAH